MNHYFRHPRTTQERRASQGSFCRARRNLHNLISAWDDISRHLNKCWKSFRKTQYKTKNICSKKDSTKYGQSMSKRDHFYLEHSQCYLKSKRCNYCRKMNIWKDYNNWLGHLHKKWEQDKLEEEKQLKKERKKFSCCKIFSLSNLYKKTRK